MFYVSPGALVFTQKVSRNFLRPSKKQPSFSIFNQHGTYKLQNDCQGCRGNKVICYDVIQYCLNLPGQQQ